MLFLRRLACPNGECGELVPEEVCESYLVAPCAVVVLKELNTTRQVSLLFKLVCGFIPWGLGVLASGILLALQLRSRGPTFAIAGPMPLLLH